MNINQVVQVFKSLMQGPSSRIELANRAKARPKTVGKMLKELKMQKMIYVIDYSKVNDGRSRVKVYAIGDGEDAKPIRPDLQKQRSRRSYLKKTDAQSSFVPSTKFANGKSPWQ